MSLHPIRHGESGVGSGRKQVPCTKMALSEAVPLDLYGKRTTGLDSIPPSRCSCGKVMARSNSSDKCFACQRAEAKACMQRISMSTFVSDKGSLRDGNPFYGKPYRQRVNIPINRHRV
jgi:hypothetical protein